jgi:quinol monooxygenase YgiN
MIGYALYARLEAKPEKVEAVAEFLAQALELASRETTTPIWFALRLSDTTFGIFDAFASEADRQAHLSGPIGQALMARAAELFSAAPVIEFMEILGLKDRTQANG